MPTGKRLVPFQVYLEKELQRRLRALARQKAVSQSELVRRFIEDGLAREAVEQDPALRIIGIGSSGLTDVAARHDEYLAETYRDQGR